MHCTSFGLSEVMSFESAFVVEVVVGDSDSDGDASVDWTFIGNYLDTLVG